jgi:hypothetical protein
MYSQSKIKTEINKGLKMSEAYKDLPDDVSKLIDEPLLPLSELDTYGAEAGIYELDEIEEAGYKKVILYQAANDLMFTRIVKADGLFNKPVFELIEASNKDVAEGTVHAFHSAPEDSVREIFPKAA